MFASLCSLNVLISLPCSYSVPIHILYKVISVPVSIPVLLLGQFLVPVLVN